MANIQPEIDDFRNAVYGEEVRGAMISLAEKVNGEVEDNTDRVDSHEADIAVAIEDAEAAASSAIDAASAAGAATSAANTATTNANTARTAANDAATSATNAAATASAASEAASAAETMRAAAEASRVAAENQRVAAEQSRAQAEQTRGSAEATRQENESDRQAAEASRVTAEAMRTGSETARVNAESARASAETSRVTAENNRANTFAQMQQQILPPATNTTLGGVIIGDGIDYDSTGKISIEGGTYETSQHAAETYATISDVAGKANSSHVHSASDITSGTLPVSRGGTGNASAADERNRLGLGNTTGAVPVASGGTGADTAAGARSNLGLYSATELDAVLEPLLAAMANAKALLGQLGLDANDDPVIDAATARSNLDAAQANGATGTLKSAEDGIGDLAESIADVESSTATANHAIGDHFMLGNELRKATSAIATGESITSSNSTADTVQSQIDTLRDSVAYSSHYGTDNKVICVKFGRVVMIYVRGLSGNTTNAYQVPTAYAPTEGSVTAMQGLANIDVNGKINTTSSGSCWDQFMFVGRA